MVKKEKRVISKEGLEIVAARFQSLSDPMRLQILQELGEDEMSVSGIAKMVSTTQPNVSKHLKLLCDNGLLARRQEGKTVYYSVSDKAIFEVLDTICRGLHTSLTAKAYALEMGDRGRSIKRK
jgi:DNA-binding transcriptional ArsR family regulator